MRQRRLPHWWNKEVNGADFVRQMENPTTVCQYTMLANVITFGDGEMTHLAKPCDGSLGSIQKGLMMNNPDSLDIQAVTNCVYNSRC